MMSESLTGTVRFTDIETISRHVEARNREIEQMLRTADAFQRELVAMGRMAAQMQRTVGGFRLPIFADPIQWPLEPTV